MRRLGGDLTETWRTEAEPLLRGRQTRGGSWEPSADHLHGSPRDRVTTTALQTLKIELYSFYGRTFGAE